MTIEKDKIIINIQGEKYQFNYIGNLEFGDMDYHKFNEEVLSSNKELVSYLKKNGYTKEKIMREKPFCKFRLNQDNDEAGVYLWVYKNKIRYIGITSNLHKRFYEYGNILACQIFKGGRSTNCKMNIYANKKNIAIYFLNTNEFDKNIIKVNKTKRRKIEKLLINNLEQLFPEKVELLNYNH